MGNGGGAVAPLRERILRSAEEMFRREGYKGTTFQRIADELGITKGAITYHFKSKQLIVEVLFQDYFSGLRAHIDRHPEAYQDKYWYYCVMYIYAYRAILASPQGSDLFFQREQLELWNTIKEGTICGIYREIAEDFHKHPTDGELLAMKSFDWGGRSSLYRDFLCGDGGVTVERFCYFCIYHMGLLAQLDGLTIERDIRLAFAFADAHEPPTMRLLKALDADGAREGGAPCTAR